MGFPRAGSNPAHSDVKEFFICPAPKCILLNIIRYEILYVEVSLGKILNPKLLLMCWLAPCMAATDISV